MLPEDISPPLVIAMGGISVQLKCAPSSLQASLRSYYKDFLHIGPAEFCASIHWEYSKMTVDHLDPKLIFTPDGLQFVSPEFRGFLDVSRGMADVNLQSPQPFPVIDYFIRIVFSMLAFRAGGLLFHGAGIVRNGKAFLFFGHSGSGKTTVARLSPQDIVLNDDLILLLPEDGKWIAHATAFWNPTQVHPTYQAATLVGLFLLVQARQVCAEKMALGQALAEIVSNVPVIPADTGRNAQLMELVFSMLRKVPAYRLHFLPDNSFWQAVDALAL